MSGEETKSPGQILREKQAARQAQKPAIEPEFIKFWAAFNTYAERHCNARAEGQDAESFVQQFFQRYQKDGSPAKTGPWFEANLQSVFQSVYAPPQWIEPEPSWPFFDGKPMVFISQTPLAENETTREHLTFETVLYVFGIRIPCEHGFRVEYRIVEQFNEQSEEQHLTGALPEPLQLP